MARKAKKAATPKKTAGAPKRSASPGPTKLSSKAKKKAATPARSSPKASPTSKKRATAKSRPAAGEKSSAKTEAAAPKKSASTPKTPRTRKSARPRAKVGQARPEKKAADRPRRAAASSAPRVPKTSTKKAPSRGKTSGAQAEVAQAALYERAVKHFQRRRFREALRLFEQASGGPAGALRHRARVHVQICREQLRSTRIRFKTADEYYNYGVRLINERKLREAGSPLDSALRLEPGAPHVHYAKAVLFALQNDPQGAAKHLGAAIEGDPKNRLLAVHDSDFKAIRGYPGIAKLLEAHADPKSR